VQQKKRALQMKNTAGVWRQAERGDLMDEKKGESADSKIPLTH